MGKHTFSDAGYRSTMNDAHAAGSSTFRGEENVRSGKGLDPLVDPAGNGLIRRSLSRRDRLPSGLWEMTMGTPMLVETLFDTTGSMGDNVKFALEALPDSYALLKSSDQAVLGRYDLQMVTATFNDERDQYILNRSHAEMGDKIAEQMTMLFPERRGGANDKEDPQYGLFGAAYLTAAQTNDYGLRTYHFAVSDEPLGVQITDRNLRRVYGESVYEKVTENGVAMDANSIPSVAQTVRYLLGRAHAFFLHVQDGYSRDQSRRDEVYEQWSALYGKDRVVALSNVKLLPQVQAAICGLTEGVLTLQGLPDFLRRNKVPDGEVAQIARSVANIPIGAQAALPNFNRVPKAGDLFTSKTELWPAADVNVSVVEESAPATWL